MIPLPRYHRGQGWSVSRDRGVWGYGTPWGAVAGWRALNAANRHAQPPAERARLAARRGATLLDTVSPGWAAKCDTLTLSIFDPARCVLCQVFGGYLAGVTAVRAVMTGTVRDYGFDWPIGDSRGHDDLVTAWRGEIAARRIDQYRHLLAGP